MKVVLKNVTKIFPNHNRKGPDVTAVDNFDFEMPDGKLIGLLGPSGCGKSTTLNLICGLETPTNGSIFFGDEDVTNLPAENRGIGIVFQNYALYPHLSVKKNIMFPLQNLRGKDKLSKAQMEQKVLEAAKLVQIESFLDRKPSALSGGQQQRVAIARALVKLPNVLLLDEPLSNLDARLRIQTREEIKRIQTETGITTIFVTHDQDEAMSISDLIVVMRDGVIQQTGEPQEVYDNPRNLFVAKFLGTPPINVFDGEIKNGAVYIGGDIIAKVRNVENKKAVIGIRPEGFALVDGGSFKCRLSSVEVMGRDTTVVSTNSAAQNRSVRSIISAENTVVPVNGEISFDIKRNKLFLFDTETEERIYVEFDD